MVAYKKHQILYITRLLQQELVKSFTRANLNSMATYLTLIMLAGVILFTTATEPPIREDLLTAIREMQTASYFTFVMLIKMMHERIPPNVTFLMPNDRMLSTVSLPDDAVSDLLSRHSIPSPLPFDCLSHFPTGSIIPTCEPNLTLRVSNEGRKRFYLDNIRIVRPNVCSTGPSVRCHGVDGILRWAAPPKHNNTPPHSSATKAPPPKASPLPSGYNSESPPPPKEPVSPLPPVPESMSPPVPPQNLTPSPSAPKDSDPQQRKSDSTHLHKGGLPIMITFFSVLSLMANQI